MQTFTDYPELHSTELEKTDSLTHRSVHIHWLLFFNSRRPTVAQVFLDGTPSSISLMAIMYNMLLQYCVHVDDYDYSTVS